MQYTESVEQKYYYVDRARRITQIYTLYIYVCIIIYIYVLLALVVESVCNNKTKNKERIKYEKRRRRRRRCLQALCIVSSDGNKSRRPYPTATAAQAAIYAHTTSSGRVASVWKARGKLDGAGGEDSRLMYTHTHT